MSNILRAVYSLVNNPSFEIQDIYKSKNRVNAVGDALEYYIKDLFADSINDDEKTSIAKHSAVFSYLGSDNRPPDGLLKGGDAIEVKKVDSKKGSIQLNSSPPKDFLFSSDTRVSAACKAAEKWDKRDLIYIIGQTSGGEIQQLWMVYGSCYAANKKIYTNISDTISNALNEIPDIELTETNELAGVKRIDPLNITFLRVRGMWVIEHPNNVYGYLSPYLDNCKFQMSVLMLKEKWDSFADYDRALIESITSDHFIVSDVKIKDPNNAANLLDAKFIKYFIKRK